MTLEEAIKHCEEVAKENDDSAKEFYRISKLETHPDRKYAEGVYVECKKCADEHRQLAEWLKELKKLRIENKALKNRCADFEHGAPCRYCPLDCEFRKNEFEGAR